MTDYTPAKDRFLYELARWHRFPEGKEHWSGRLPNAAQEMANEYEAAARAVLEEENRKPPIVCPSCNLEPNYLHRCAVTDLRSELAELKRRVEGAKAEMREALDDGSPVRWRSGIWAAVDILEGKVKP